METKKELRKALRLQRSALSTEAAEALSLRAQNHILAQSAWNNARCVGLYCPMRMETDTARLKNAARSVGKLTFFPRTEPAGIMEMLPCADDSLMHKSSFGILEPRPEICPQPPGSGWNLDIIIVPGIVYDRRGYRIGSAGGYYDRFFARPSMQSVIRIGLCYGFQLVDHIVPDAWDIPMHAIATEEGILWL